MAWPIGMPAATVELRSTTRVIVPMSIAWYMARRTRTSRSGLGRPGSSRLSARVTSKAR
jgi:hypothetical protein